MVERAQTVDETDRLYWRCQRLLPATDGTRYHQITIQLMPNGALELHEHEMGAGLDACWGIDDREMTVILASTDVRKLAAALIGERLLGRKDAADALVALCRSLGFEPRVCHWT
jgi:hypothetical protein